MMADALPPIRHQWPLACSPARAFQVYTTQIGQWWDARYSANSATLTGVTIEPYAGGRIYASHHDLGQHDWGAITVWEPGRRLAHTFTLAQNPAQPSVVHIEFVPFADHPGRCTLHFVHGGWSADAAPVRAKFGDWPVLLGRFAALAEGRDSDTSTGAPADSLSTGSPPGSEARP